MPSENIHQVFIANPITTNAGTDLMYFGQSPYGAGNDAAMTFANFKAQFPQTNWVNVVGATQTLAPDTSYVTNDASSLVTYTLPATAALGAVIEIAGFSSNGWTIAQAAGQLIHIGNSTTTTGVSGSLSSSNRYDAVRFVCVVANTTFLVVSAVGNLTVV